MASILTSFPLFMLLLIFVVICFYVILPVLSLFIFYLKESMDKTGGPPIVGTIFHQLMYFDTLYDFQLSKAKKHGTFRLIKPSHVDFFISNPATIEHVLKTCFSKYSKGEYNYEIGNDLFGNGIFNIDGDKWRHQRKLASSEFSTKVLRDFSSVVFRSNATKLCKMISGAASVGTLIDMQDLLMKSTLDSIFKVGFGVELDTLSGSNEQGTLFSRAFDDSNYIVFHRYVDIFWKAKRYLNIGMEAKLKKNLEVIDDFVFRLIRQKRELMKSGIERDKEDILSRFIMESEKDRETMTDKYLRDIILNFLIAGKDTSANTLTWFFYMLCKHPLIQEKIAMEIKEATGEEGALRDMVSFAGSLTDQVLDKMQYLHATLTETLRLYPAVPEDGKIADEDDVLPGGLKVKKGDGVTYLIYAMARMVDLWGDDAEEFRPERWLDNGMFHPESPFKFVTFNAGPRICLGKEFAYRQMKILAAVVLHFFKFKLDDESYIARYRTMFTLHMDKDLSLLAFHRSN